MSKGWIKVEVSLPSVHAVTNAYWCESLSLPVIVEGFKEPRMGKLLQNLDSVYWQIEGCHGEFKVLAWYDLPEYKR